MYVVAVAIQVKPGHREAFHSAVIENARGTRREPGNVRFDVLESLEDPCRLMLYEVYRTQADFEAHQRTSHYQRWREQVKDWMAVPRVGVRYRNLFPPEEGGW